MLRSSHEAFDPPTEQDVAQHLAIGGAVGTGCFQRLKRARLVRIKIYGQLDRPDRHIGEFWHIVGIAFERPVGLDCLILEMSRRALRA